MAKKQKTALQAAADAAAKKAKKVSSNSNALKGVSSYNKKTKSVAKAQSESNTYKGVRQYTRQSNILRANDDLKAASKAQGAAIRASQKLIKAYQSNNTERVNSLMEKAKTARADLNTAIKPLRNNPQVPKSAVQNVKDTRKNLTTLIKANEGRENLAVSYNAMGDKQKTQTRDMLLKQAPRSAEEARQFAKRVQEVLQDNSENFDKAPFEQKYQELNAIAREDDYETSMRKNLRKINKSGWKEKTEANANDIWDGSQYTNKIKAKQHLDNVLAGKEHFFPGESAFTMSTFNDKYASELTDKEKKVYNYIYETQGTQKADEFLDSIQYKTEGRYIEKKADEAENSFMKKALIKGESAVNSAVKGVYNAGKMLIDDKMNSVSGGEANADNLEMKSEFQEDTQAQKINNAHKEKYGSNIGWDLYETTMQQLPSIVISTLTGSPAAGAAFQSASAAGNNYEEMKRQGYSDSQARNYAAVTGSLEGTLQYALGGIGKLGGKISGGAVNKAIKGVTNAYGRLALQTGGEMLSEGLEESSQDVLAPIVKAALTNGDVDIDWGQAAYSGLLGALSAGVMNAPATAINTVNTARAGKEIRNNADSLEALTNSNFDRTNSAVKKLKMRLEQGKARNFEIGSLAQLVQEESEAKVSNAIDNTLRRKSTGKKSTDNAIKEVIMKQSRGEELDASDMRLMSANAEVVGEINYELNRHAFDNEFQAEAVDMVMEEVNTGNEQTDAALNPVIKKVARNEELTPREVKLINANKDVVNEIYSQTQAISGMVTTEVAMQAISPERLAQLEEPNTDSTPFMVNTPNGGRMRLLGFSDNDTVTVTDDSGNVEVVPSADVEYDSAAHAGFAATLKGMPEKEAEGILKFMPTDMSSEEIIDRYSQIKELALEGVPLDAIMSGNAYDIEGVSTDFIRNAYEAGTEERRAEAQSRQTPNYAEQAETFNIDESVDMNNPEIAERVNILQAMQQMFGFNVEAVFDPSDANTGTYSNNTIRINLATADAMSGAFVQTMAHEMTHWGKEVDPEGYEAFQTKVLDFLYQRGVDIEAQIEQQFAYMEFDPTEATPDEIAAARERALDEITAEAAETLLKDSEALRELASDSKVKEFIKKIFERIAEFFSKLFSGNIENTSEATMAVANAQRAEIEDILQSFDAMLRTSSQNALNGEQIMIDNSVAPIEETVEEETPTVETVEEAVEEVPAEETPTEVAEETVEEQPKKSAPKKESKTSTFDSFAKKLEKKPMSHASNEGYGTVELDNGENIEYFINDGATSFVVGKFDGELEKNDKLSSPTGIGSVLKSWIETTSNEDNLTPIKLLKTELSGLGRTEVVHLQSDDVDIYLDKKTLSDILGYVRKDAKLYVFDSGNDTMGNVLYAENGDRKAFLLHHRPVDNAPTFDVNTEREITPQAKKPTGNGFAMRLFAKRNPNRFNGYINTEVNGETVKVMTDGVRMYIGDTRGIQEDTTDHTSVAQTIAKHIENYFKTRRETSLTPEEVKAAKGEKFICLNDGGKKVYYNAKYLADAVGYVGKNAKAYFAESDIGSPIWFDNGEKRAMLLNVRADQTTDSQTAEIEVTTKEAPKARRKKAAPNPKAETTTETPARVDGTEWTDNQKKQLAKAKEFMQAPNAKIDGAVEATDGYTYFWGTDRDGYGWFKAKTDEFGTLRNRYMETEEKAQARREAGRRKAQSEELNRAYRDAYSAWGEEYSRLSKKQREMAKLLKKKDYVRELEKLARQGERTYGLEVDSKTSDKIAREMMKTFDATFLEAEETTTKGRKVSLNEFQKLVQKSFEDYSDLVRDKGEEGINTITMAEAAPMFVDAAKALVMNGEEVAGEYDAHKVMTAISMLINSYWNADKVTTLRDRYDKQLSKLAAMYKDRIARNKLKQQTAELRRKVVRKIEKLARQVDKANNNHEPTSIPTELKPAMAELLKGLNIESTKGTKINADVRKVWDRLRLYIKDAPDNVRAELMEKWGIDEDDLNRAARTKNSETGSWSLLDDIAKLGELAELMGGRSFRELGKHKGAPTGTEVAILEVANNLVNSINKGLSQVNALIRRSEFVSRSAQANEVVKAIQSTKGRKAIGKDGEAKDLAHFTSMLKDFRTSTNFLMEKVVGYDDNNPLVKAKNELIKASRESNRKIMQWTKVFHEIQEENQKAYKAAQTELVDTPLTDVKGRKVRLTKMEIMATILTYEREINHPTLSHLTEGGATYLNREYIAKRDLQAAETHGTRVRADQFTEANIREMESVLGKWDTKYFNAIKDFMRKTVRAEVNEYYYKTRGYYLGGEDFYYPESTDSTTREADIQKTVIKSDAFTPGWDHVLNENANQRCVLKSADLTLTNMINTVARRTTVEEKLTALDRLMNTKAVGENGRMAETVNGVIRTHWNDQTYRDIHDTLAKEAGAYSDTESIEKMANWLISGYANAKIMLNPGTLLKVGLSGMMVKAFVSEKSFLIGMGDLFKAVGVSQKALFSIDMTEEERSKALHWVRTLQSEIDEHTATNWLRRVGIGLGDYYNAAQARSMTQRQAGKGSENAVGKSIRSVKDFIREKPAEALEFMDGLGTAIPWLCCKAEAEARLGKDKVGSKEYWDMVTDIYDTFVEQTQSGNNTMFNAGAINSKLLKPLTLFRNEVFKTGALLSYRAEKAIALSRKAKNDPSLKAEAKKATKSLRRVTVGTASTIVSMALAQVAATLFKGKQLGDYEEDDKDRNKPFYEAMLEEMLSSVIQDVVSYSSPIVGNNALSYFEYGDITIPGVSDVKHIWNGIVALCNVTNALWNDEKLYKVSKGTSIGTVKRDIRKGIRSAFEVVGIPIGQVDDIANGIMNIAEEIYNGEFNYLGRTKKYGEGTYNTTPLQDIIDSIADKLPLEGID